MADRVEAARELLERRRCRAKFLAWCLRALPSIEPKYPIPASHHRLLISELQWVADTPDSRLMVFMPPGSAKSTYSSKLFPSWLLSRDDFKVIGASHNTELAESLSGAVQSLAREHTLTLGYGLTSESKGRWSTTNGASYLARGVGSGVAGFRADCAVIDDPVKGAEAADSQTQRDAVWEWYNRDLLTRLRPGGRVVLVMQRWHTDDLAGRILAREEKDWRVVRLPALAEADDALGRSPGTPLWADDNYGYGERLAGIRARSSLRDWSALYQQRPYSDEGSIIKREWWRPWIPDAKPEDEATIETAAPRAVLAPLPARPDFVIVSLDTAYTEKDQNDPTGCTIWYVTQNPETFRSTILLRYGWAKRLAFPALVNEIEDTADHFGIRGVPMRVLVEAKASGLSVIQELRRRRPELNIHAVNPRGPGGGDKVARAHAVSSVFEGGGVFALAKWEGGKVVFRDAAQAVVDECAAFPLGQHDDLTDSVTQALRHIRDAGVELFAEDEPVSPAAVPADLY